MKIGFIGTGVMGCGMASNLQKLGHPLYVYNRTKSKAQSLIDNGAIWAKSPKEMAQVCDVIFTIIGMPTDVEEVYLGEDGLINNAKPGTILVDMTTSKPELAVEIFNKAKEKGIHAADAPVSGGDTGAIAGTLTLFIGAEEETYNNLLPFFNAMGSNIVYLGKPGNGQHGKMANQIAIAGVSVGAAESLAYATKAGLDLKKIHGAVSSGAAGSWHLSNLGPRVLAGNFDPGFYIKHFIKDMRIAYDEATKNGVELPGLKTTLSQYESLQNQGFEDLGTQALYKLYTELS